jgi:DNA-binding transcriptional ArsR family regulator
MMKDIDKAKERQDYLFHEMSSLLEAIASPVRLRILHFLTQAPHSVDQLAQKIGQSVANTSMHLKKMQRENILKTESLAQKRIYSLSNPETKNFWEQIQHFALIHHPDQTMNSADIYQEDFEWSKLVDDTVKLIKSRKVTLIDVRPDDEIDQIDLNYKKYVLHIPFNQIKKSMKSIPTSRPVLIICRGRLCLMSNEATAQLRKLNLNAYKLNMSWHQLSQILSEV